MAGDNPVGNAMGFIIQPGGYCGKRRREGRMARGGGGGEQGFSQEEENLGEELQAVAKI